MTTDHLTVAVTAIAEKTLKDYDTFLREYIECLCPAYDENVEEYERISNAVHGILHVMAAGTADTIVKSFSYAFRMDD